jgi:type IV pilus assembly protein PilB
VCVTTNKKRLAIIDDDADLRAELATYFADDYIVDLYPGEPGTLKSLRGNPPDLLLIDIDLQRLDGFDVLKLMTSSPELRPAVVVVLSALNDFASFEKAHRFGAVEYLHKPFRPEELAVKLTGALARRQQRSAGRLKLGALLVSSGLLSQDLLERALARQKADGGRLGDVLVREGLVSEESLVNALAGQMRLAVIDLAQSGPTPSAIGFLPRDFVIRHRVMPLRLDDHGALVLAMTNPLDVISIDEVGLRTKRRVVPVICTESAFDEAIGLFYSTRGKLKETRDDEAGGAGEDVAQALDASIIEIVDALISDAANMHASDIHLEPREDCLQVRCRIDGVLHDLREFPPELQPGIISRLKIMASMDIAERRLPQDGRTSFETAGDQLVDLRLASIPSLYGENIAMRILEVSPLPPTLASLGLAGETLARFERAIRISEGGVLICGPTGSGKSTTLYTALELIKSAERKVYTVEDPIERKLHGVVQTEVKPVIGLTFARALRSLVRADPDVIMVGEIRDVETAKMAADAAITGHLVFSTLHTNDAPSAVHRLVEMGVPRYLVAAAFRCVVGQRLVRRLCPYCRETETLTPERWQELGLGTVPRKRLKVYNPVGCAKCFGTGYRGRIGLYEVLEIDDDMRDLITSGGSIGDLQTAARDAGVDTLREDGMTKVLDGVTSYLELLRVTI